MSWRGVLILIAIAGATGIVAEWVVGFGAGSFIVATLVGFVGASFGTWLATVAGLPALYVVTVEGMRIDLVWTVAGAIVLLIIWERISRFFEH